MAGKILLEVVTPDRLLLSQPVDMVIAPGAEGEFGALPGHCHFLSTLRIGELRYQIQETWHYMSVLWGFAEVTPTKVTVMAEVAERAEEIDVGRARAAVEKAEQQVRMGGLPSDVRDAEIRLEKARLRQKIAERAREGGHT